MDRLKTPHGTTVSYEKHGSGPPLVLVHGSFSDHHTNWEFVLPSLAREFTVYAIARRGRGETDATDGHSVEDEASDVAALIEHVGQPVFLLGHSYGAQTALAAAASVPGSVRKLVLYEGPWPRIVPPELLASIEAKASAGDWDGMSIEFFSKAIRVPLEELESLRLTELWPPILADAPATLGDVRALSRYGFRPERFHDLRMPVLLQIGTESHRDLYVTDALMKVLPDARIGELNGQAHEGMTTAPDMYADAVTEFFLRR
jgi:pimeloyl-ACP methyl ester carboxylesterase